MTTIEGLRLRGIRSFSPENATHIQFFKPLTLIVGQNGAGKTTIIEALKAATTGLFPGNSARGQTFVIDPNVAGLAEVKAQIHLRFTNKSGRPMEVARSYSVTATKSGLKFKTIDSTLATKNDRGEKVVMNKKCADMDREIPELMGVPRAVLENVVFVHQEDSNWPLSDSKTLKEKFDDIFSATRFSEALDTLTEVIKKKTEEARALESQLELKSQQRQQADTIRFDLDKAREDKEGNAAKIAKLEQELKVLAEARKAHEAVLKEAGDRRVELGNLEAQREVHLAEVADLYRKMPVEYTESDEVLREFAASLEQRIGERSVVVAGLEERKTGIRKEQAALQRTVAEDEAALRGLAAEMDAHARDVAARGALAQQTAARAGVAGLAASAAAAATPEAATDADVAAVRVRAEERLRALQQASAQALEAQTAEDASLGHRVDEARSELNRHEAQAAVRRDENAKLVAKVAQLARDLRGANDVTNQLEDLDGELRAAEDRRAAAARALAAEGADAEIAALQARMGEVSAEVKRLNEERKIATTYLASMARAEDRKRELAEKTATLAAKADSVRRALTAQGLPCSGALEALEGEAARAREDLRERAESRASEAKAQEARQGASEGSARELESALAAARRQIESLLRQGCSPNLTPDQVQAELARLARDADDKGKEIAVLEDGALFFGAHLRHLGDTGRCPTCDRGFPGGDAELARVRDHLRAKEKGDPVALASARAALAELQERVRQLQAQAPLAAQLAKLQQEHVPDLERRLAAARKAQADAQAAAAEASAAHQAAQRGLDALDAVQGAVFAVGTLRAEVSRATESLRLEQAKLDVAAVTRSADEIGELLNERQKELDDIMKRDAATRKRADVNKAEIAELEAIARRLTARKTELLERGSRLQAMAREKAEAELRLAGAEAEDARSRQEALPLRERVEELQRLREERSRAMAARTAEAQGAADALARDLAALASLTRAIAAFAGSGKAARARQLEAQVAAARARVQELADAHDRAQEEISQTQTKMADERESRRQLDDALRHRERKQVVAQLEARIASLRAAGQGADEVRRAEEALKAGDTRASAARTQRDQLRGMTAQLERQARDLEHRLRDHLGVEKECVDLTVKAVTARMAIDDLDRFKRGLDQAIMKHHEKKMHEINRILRDLFRQVYTAGDIDSIQIKANNERTGPRNSYQYRVIMTKNGMEYDLRGRCSAGQKVLSCLLIRLALAEAFCADSGIIALDEPTTNLDARNILHLGQALLRIIDARRGQAAFQLIVITHDEGFVSLLSRAHAADYFLRVTKRLEPPHYSQVVKEAMASLE